MSNKKLPNPAAASIEIADYCQKNCINIVCAGPSFPVFVESLDANTGVYTRILLNENRCDLRMSDIKHHAETINEIANYHGCHVGHWGRTIAAWTNVPCGMCPVKLSVIPF